jgi:hemoglobin/transferrin/lactoferrin receptor protein
MAAKLSMVHGVVICLALAPVRTISQPESFPGSAREANATPDSVQLEPVVVVGTLEERPALDIPATVGRVEREALEVAGSLPEAMDKIPGIMVQKTSRGQGSPFIRGFTGFRNLMLIDGIRLNNSVFREGPNQYWNTVDNLSIDHLEVLKGPSSVLYGSDAIGGTVNAITKSREAYGPGFDWDRSLYYRVSSAESSHIARAEVGGNLDERLGILLGGGIKEFGDLRGGKDVGRQSHTGFFEYDLDFKLNYLLTPNSRVVVAHQTVDQNDIWRTHATIYGLQWHGTTRGSDLRRSLDQRRNLTYAQYHLEQPGSFVDELQFSVSHQLQSEEEDRIRGNGMRQLQGFDVNTLGTFIHLHSPTPIGRFIYGAEYYRDWVSSYSDRYLADGTFSRSEIQGSVADDSTYDSLAGFVTDQIPLGEHLELFLGARYTINRADAEKVRDPLTGGQTSLSDDFDALTGSARAMWSIDEEKHWNLFAGASQGFRSPNLSDLTRYDIARSGELEIPSSGLKPEHFISYETGVKVDFEKVSAEAAYFYTDIEDLIVRIPTGRTVLVQGTPALEVVKGNSGDGYVHGVEFLGEYRFAESWSTQGRFTWSEGEVDTFSSLTSARVYQTEYLSRVMPITAQIGLRYQIPEWHLAIQGWCTIAGRQDKLSSGDLRDTDRIPPGGTPGYSVFDLTLTWEPCENFMLRASIENIGDKDYRIHGSGVNEPGRNFIAAMNVRF